MTNGGRARMHQRIIEVPADLSLRLTLGSRNIEPGSGDGWWATRTPDGPATVCLHHEGNRVMAAAWGPGSAWILEQTPRLVGNDDRPEGFSPAHPLLRELHRRNRGMRVGRTDRVFESIVPAILQQKITTRESGTNFRILTAAFSVKAPGPRDLYLPVDPEVLAEVSYWQLHELGIERRRAELLRFVARRKNRLEEITTMDKPAAYERLMAFPGIGPWTAALVMGTALGDADAVPIGDFHIPNTVSWALAGEPRGDDRRMLELLEPYRGHRGRVIRLLKAGGVHAPRYGPKTPVRSIAEF